MSTSRPFTTAELADYAERYGDVPLMISSHGEVYGVDLMSYEPDHNAIILNGSCAISYINPAAISLEDDPEGTAALRHRIAEQVARHLEEMAAGFRARFPLSLP